MQYISRLLRLCTLKSVIIAVILSLLLISSCFAWVAYTTHDNPIPKKAEREAENTKNNIVTDVTELYPIHVLDIVVPHTIEDIVKAVKTHDRISIGGGRNSMGGQTASRRAVQIDMREYTKVLAFSTTTKEITVQAGIRWYDIQKYIDPYGLAVEIMQTYSNFTVGGSVSVNVHGRYVGLGPIVMSVRSFRIILANGEIVEASPSTHSDIFYSAIGGLGGLGVISDVTLALADNVNVERNRVVVPTSGYAEFFAKTVRSNPDVIFHNGDMYPPAFENISAVSWAKTDKAPTVADRLIPRAGDYWLERAAWVVMSQWPGGRWIREHILEPLIYHGTPPVHTRNYEASYDIAELEPESRDTSTYVLQEYFVPVERFDEWVPKMKKVFDDYHVNVLNVSIRHAKPDPGVILKWAPKESFAFVVYYKQGTSEKAKREVSVWTRAMIDQVLSVGGTYYLPYQPLATDEQFHRAYPGAIEYFEIKKHYDPTDKFTNNLWDTYYSEEKLAAYSEKHRENALASTTSDFFRNPDNTIITLPEWYIVYAADEYARVLRDSFPSAFPFFAANTEYWKQYDRVFALTSSSTNDNSDYRTVLNVIGWSFTVENFVKGVYEATFGRVSEWIAGDVQVPEDQYAAAVAKEYAEFLYDYPWYNFPYAQKLRGVWHVSSETPTSFRQGIRRFERKLFLSMEYGIKGGYASIIAYVTHAKFGIQDDVVSAIVTRDGGKTLELVDAPHYQPFTRKLLAELEKEMANEEFSILNIAGNDSIALTYADVVGAEVPSYTTELARDPEIQSVSMNVPVLRDRVTVLVNVRDITSLYRDLRVGGVTIDHFYDF